MAVFANADTVDTRGMSHLGQLGTDSIGHVILCDGGWCDVPVAGTESLRATSKIGSTRHGHLLKLSFLTRAVVGKDETGATVLILLPETNVDRLLSLTECHGTVENALFECLLGDGSLGTLCGVSTKRDCGTLVDLHHPLCAILVILHEDLGSARGLVAVGDGVVSGHGLSIGVVKCDWIAGTLVSGKLFRTGIVDIDVAKGLELLLERIDGHANGGGRGPTCGNGYL